MAVCSTTHKCLSYSLSLNCYRSFSKATELKFLFKKPKLSLSFDSLKSPPVKESVNLRNQYIPLTRRTIVRELLEDSSVVPLSERASFEAFASKLDQKILDHYHILQTEASFLLSSLERAHLNSTTLQSLSPHPVSESLSSSDFLDQEFWLLRRLAEIAPAAGFIETPQDNLERACQPRRLKLHGLVTFVDPSDYDVLRFWTRGLHPCRLLDLPSAPTEPTSEQRLGDQSPLPPTSSAQSAPVRAWWRFVRSARRFLLRLGSTRVATSSQVLHHPDELCHGRVLMAVRLKSDKSLFLKLFEHVPCETGGDVSLYANSLPSLLPKHQASPLGIGAHAVLIASTLTAVGCLGIVTPFAYLIASHPDVVFAWSIAATATAAGTACAVWSRHWKAQANWAAQLQQLHYTCGRASGAYCLHSLLKLAREEEFKAALLAYALLLEPTAAHTPLTPLQLGIRAESWIAKRMKPQDHMPLPSSTSKPHKISSLRWRFTGGSGPHFDLTFDANRPLQLLRRLDLVRGQEDRPMAVRLDVANQELETTTTSTIGLSRLWLADPLIDEEDVGQSTASSV